MCRVAHLSSIHFTRSYIYINNDVRYCMYVHTQRSVSEKMLYQILYMSPLYFLGNAKVMSLWIHVRGTNGQGNNRQDRGMPRGSDSRSVRDPVVQEDQ